MPRLLALAFGGWILCGTAIAAEQFETKVVDFFLGNCVLNLPSQEEIRAAARLFGWHSLSGDEAALVAPTDPSATYEVWLALDGNQKFFVGLSEGTIGSVRVVTCSVSAMFDPVVFASLLADKLALTYLNDEHEAGQRYQSWTTTANGNSILIMLTSQGKLIGGTISASVKLRE